MKGLGKKIYSLILMFAFIAGCASSEPTFLPNGAEGHSIDCSAEGYDWGGCYNMAGDTCGSKGYEIIAGDPEAIGYRSGSMLIACK